MNSMKRKGSRTSSSKLKIEEIPKELQDIPRWVNWRLEECVDRKTGEVRQAKVPYRVDGKGKAKSTDPATWSTFGDALAGCCQRFDGIGFVFSAEDDIMGIDLDHCRNPRTGRIAAWARRIQDDFETYMEVSVSGTGLHLYLRGHKPPGARSRVGDVEIYESGRYFIVTGRARGDASEVQDCQKPLDALCAELWALEKKVDDGAPISEQPSLDDEVLLERALSNPRFAALWRADTSGYKSPSEAVQALLAHLAVRTNFNKEQMDRLFCRSGLFSSKWEREDIRETSISRACDFMRGKGHASRDLGDQAPTAPRERSEALTHS